MRYLGMVAVVLVGCVALCGCSDGEADKAAQEAERLRLFEEDFKPLQKKYMELFDEEREAAKKIIPIKNQIRGAKKAGNDNLAAELQTQLESATGSWQSLKNELTAMEKDRADMMRKLRKLGHKFPGDR